MAEAFLDEAGEGGTDRCTVMAELCMAEAFLDEAGEGVWCTVIAELLFYS